MACKRMIFNNISGIITMLKMYNFTSDKIVLTYSLQFLFQVISFHLEVELKKSRPMDTFLEGNHSRIIWTKFYFIPSNVSEEDLQRFQIFQAM